VQAATDSSAGGSHSGGDGVGHDVGHGVKHRLRIVAALSGLALLARVLNVLASRDSPFFEYLPVDCGEYDEWGQAIAAGEWLGSEIFYQDPLYPYFLGVFYSVFGRHLTALLLFQALLGALNVPLVYGIARRLWNERVALLTAALVALYAPFVFYDGLVLKTFLEVLLLNTSLYALLRASESAPGEPSLRTWALAAGVALGVGALTRANFLLLVPVVLAWLFVYPPWPEGGRQRSRQLGITLSLLLGIALAILPVTIRNYVVGDEFVLITSQGGQNLYTGNHPANEQGVYVAPRFVRQEPGSERLDFKLEAERRTGRAMRETEVSSYWFGETLRVAAEDPTRIARLYAKKLGLLLHRYEVPDNHDISFSGRYSPVIHWNPVVFAVVGPLAFAGLLLGWRERRRLALAYAILAVYLLSIAAFFVFARYRLPVLPLLLLFAAGGAVGLWDAWRAADRRRIALALCGLALGLVLVHRPSAIEREGMGEAIWIHLGNAYMKQGRPDDGLAAYRSALSLAPANPYVNFNIGLALQNTGDREAAIEHFEATLAAQPGWAHAHAALAALLMEKPGK
jgi:4-amino-4-deoxy-L-arabinose transferase-like glycosyltransferase